MVEIIIKNPLFKNCSEIQVEKLMASITIERLKFAKDDVAYSTDSKKKQIMFILSGSAKVEQIHEDGSSLFLKRMKPGDVFGVLSIFNEIDKFPTHIVFEESSQVLCILESEVLKLIRQDETILRNYLSFYNGQVQYLLERISIFSLVTAEERVLQYITQLEVTKGKKNRVMTKVELSEFLGISRATLYRAIGKLEEEGVIYHDGTQYRLSKNKRL